MLIEDYIESIFRSVLNIDDIQAEFTLTDEIKQQVASLYGTKLRSKKRKKRTFDSTVHLLKTIRKLQKLRDKKIQENLLKKEDKVENTNEAKNIKSKEKSEKKVDNKLVRQKDGAQLLRNTFTFPCGYCSVTCGYDKSFESKIRRTNYYL
jgi:hypothetical protein